MDSADRGRHADSEDNAVADRTRAPTIGMPEGPDAALRNGAIGGTPLRTQHHALKVATKWLLRNDNLVWFLKSAKIAFDLYLDRPYDPIFRMLPEAIGRPDPIIVDVGANMGQFASRIARQFPGGRIYSFEPIRTSARGLRRVLGWLKLDNVQVFNEAMCDKVGVEAMHVPVFSTYADGALAVLEGSKRSHSNVTYNVEQVFTNTIDAFVSAHEIARLDFLKVDTEGAEERVVRGGMDTITRALPMLYLEALPGSPWLRGLYDLGYHPFYTNGKSLHMPRPGEQRNDVPLVHQSQIARLTRLMD